MNTEKGEDLHIHPNQTALLKSSLSSYLKGIILITRKQLPGVAFNLLPGPVQNKFRPHSETKRAQAKTAYLDGFRGYAAVGVIILHSVMGFYPESGYGYNGQEKRNYILQMPFFRLLYTGQPTLFFLIGGYVLSLGTLKKARSHAFGPMQLDISSKIFRRGFRLYMPAIIATLIPCLMSYYDIFPGVVDFGEGMPHNEMDFPEPQKNLVQQLLVWLKSIPPLFWLFDWENYSQNSPWAYQLWTVPVEFRCSIALFTVNSALSRCTPRGRLFLNGILSLFLLAFNRWDVFLFTAGGFIAELDLIREESTTPSRRTSSLLDLPEEESTKHTVPITSNPTPNRRQWARILPLTILILSLWILSVPAADIWKTTTYTLLEKYSPPTYTAFYRFWDAIGAVLLISSFTHLPAIQTFFSKPLFLYLGKISFSLYLTHTIALKLVLYPVMPWVWSVTGYQTDLSYTVGFLISLGYTVAAAIWIADLFYRGVEVPCMHFSVWLDRAFDRLER